MGGNYNEDYYRKLKASGVTPRQHAQQQAGAGNQAFQQGLAQHARQQPQQAGQQAGNYAPEYSKESMQNLVGGYADLLDPYYQKSKRSLASTLAGTPGMWGSPRLKGTGEIESARIGQIGGYAQNLAQQALDAQRQERLTAEGRAYEDPYRQAGLTGMFGGQQTMQGRQVGSQLASESLQREYIPKTFEEGQRRFDIGADQWGQQFGLNEQQAQDAMKTSALNREWYPSQFTGTTPTGQSTMAKDQMTAALTGMYGGNPTAAYQAQMMPWVTQGYVDQKAAGLGGLGNITTEQQLQKQTPEWQEAQRQGFNDPYQMALYSQFDPEGMKWMYRNPTERSQQQARWGF